jgi:hypothetical protein
MTGIKKKPVSMLDAEDRLDLVDILKTGPVGHNHTPEQERNFDVWLCPTGPVFSISTKSSLSSASNIDTGFFFIPIIV